MLRNILGGLLGFAIGIFSVGFLGKMSQRVYPPPKFMDIEDKDAMAEFAANMPTKALAIILLSHFVGTFLAAFISSRIASKNKFFLGLITGLVILIAAATIILTMRHAIYISILDIFLSIVGLYLGARLGSAQEVVMDL